MSLTVDSAFLRPKLSVFSTQRGIHVANRAYRNLPSRHREWEINRLLPVLAAWLIVYAIAVVGALSGTRPEPVTSPAMAALAGHEVAETVR